ncbi:MAG: tRNA (adenosine(37)-N6)-dimethylallyltransferase MiaA [Muribaculaceae bacterium]|nr:tRNA (adenosine(37)-N6)-dimethylallyltransferase MiaA [Muribaculaceae bacterium]MBQ9073928.1 tRNA (adenosine(37)-N6)-dimethylallyltransferase MiaA [Muribaculaceae bacterium]
MSQNNSELTLIVITGPTGSGKTALSLSVAKKLNCHILSADSRQLYRDIPIGTAAPTIEELQEAPHHFVGTLGLEDYYSAAQYESDALSLLGQLWQENRYALMCGGSMMYVDAVCRGIDELPTISAAIREKAMAIYEEGGLSLLQKTLQRLDPEYYEIVDKNNHKRLVHAIEIIMEAGVPYSSLRTGEVKQRDFRIVKVAINYEREQLFDRINRRVDKMIAEGLEEEARRVYHLRHLNSLNTVGYKEMFAYFDGTMDYETAIARIAKNTRVYAKKQLTWLKKDPTIHYLNPSTAFEELMALI